MVIQDINAVDRPIRKIINSAYLFVIRQSIEM